MHISSTSSPGSIPSQEQVSWVRFFSGFFFTRKTSVGKLYLMFILYCCELVTKLVQRIILRLQIKEKVFHVNVFKCLLLLSIHNSFLKMHQNWMNESWKNNLKSVPLKNFEAVHTAQVCFDLHIPHPCCLNPFLNIVRKLETCFIGS